MSSIKEFQHLRIPLQHLKSATNNFGDTNCIGHGGFGKVYKGEILLSGVLIMVAVKRLDRSLGQGPPEFWNEVMLLSVYKHENLVSLLGFCDEGGENILVYEYLSNKSLDLYLSSTDLSWEQRFFICLGAARGLKFLHEPAEGSKQRVLHRDIKSANILLDDNWRPKISDFGLSKLGPANQQFTFIFSNAVGTPGYCDPLYAHTGFLTKESDVYSFGAVLFEVLCGRPAYVQNYNDIRRSLTALARKCYEEKKLDTIIHIGLKDMISTKSLEWFSAIAYQCLHIDRAERPSMAKIVEEIDVAYYYQILRDLRELPLKEIEVATENFKVSIGESKYGQMYVGELSIFGKPAAVVVKRFHEHSGLSIKDFLLEIFFLLNRPHPNLLSLLGYCDEEREMIFVYEYPERGCLDQYISRSNTTSPTLTWLQRLKICASAAHGLYHLHHQSVTHHEFKSANILLDDMWVAKVFNFVLFTPSSTDLDRGAVSYSAPEYIINGIESEEADVYSFGMVLFEVLCGRLCTEDVDGYRLSGKLIKDLYEKKKLDEIVDPSLREQMISSYFIDKYSAIAYQCLLDDPKERPSMNAVHKELEELLRIETPREEPIFVGIKEKFEIAIKYHEFDSYEFGEFNYAHWEHKLPFDLQDLIKKLNFLGVNVTDKEFLWLLHKGMLLYNGTRFISIKDDGTYCEMRPAREFLYPSSKTYEWLSSSKFRFSEVARFRNKEQLNIRCRIRTSFSSGIMYAASLVFYFQRESQIMYGKSSQLMRIKWKCEELNVSTTHFAEQTEDGWMKIRLWHFVSGDDDPNFDIVLDKISYFEEEEFPDILIHGIEFQRVEMTEEHEETEGLEDLSVSDEEGNWEKCIARDYQDILQRSDTHLEYTTQKDLYFRLCAGILIKNGRKWFSLCKSTGGKCHMLPAIEVFTTDAHFEDFDKLSLPESRFNEVIQLQAGSSCSFECELEPDMFSYGNVYACYLVFKFAEDHIWHKYRRLVRASCRLDTKETGMLFAHLNSRETVNIPTIIPKNYNGFHDSSNMPITKDPIMSKEFMDESVHNWMKPRNDGWMEVILSKSLDKLEDHKWLSMTLNSQESDFYGIIVQGIEFRPMQRKNLYL